MDIDPNVPVAGLRPAVLKRIFRRGDFSTLTFAKTTKLSLEVATQTLTELTKLGWVTPQPPGWWAATELGGRLAATPLVPPIPVLRGRQLLERVIAVAEAINADGTHYYVVPRLVLFGSLLTAPLGAKVGDVDVAFELGDRDPLQSVGGELWRVDIDLCPPTYGNMLVFWPSERVEKRLRKVGRSVSLHHMRDLEAIGAARQVVYQFDRETRQGAISLPW